MEWTDISVIIKKKKAMMIVAVELIDFIIHLGAKAPIFK